MLPKAIEPTLSYDIRSGILTFKALHTVMACRVSGDGAGMARGLFRGAGREITRSSLTGKDLTAFDKLVAIIGQAGGSYSTREG